MFLSKRAIVGLAALLTLGFSKADFDGPAPIAWRWADRIEQRPTGAPTMIGDRVYAAVGSRMYCLDRETGNLVWRFPVGEPLQANFTTGASVSDGIMVAAADDKAVYGIDVATGEKVWQYVAPEGVFARPVIAGNYVVVAMASNRLMALSLTSGAPIWQQAYVPTAGIYSSMVAWQNNVVFLTSDGLLTSLDVTTQRPSWRPRQFSSVGPLSGLSVFGDVIYVTSGSYVTSMAASSGRLRWEQIVPGVLRYSAAAGPDGVVCVTDDGRMHMVNPSGRLVFRSGIDLKSNPVASPAFTGRMVAIPTSNGALNLLDPKSGEVVWSFVVPPMIKGMTMSTGTTAGGASGSTAGGAANTGPGEIVIKSVKAVGSIVAQGDTLVMMAEDGSILAFDKHLGVDKTAPNIEMLWPNAGDQVSGRAPMEMIFKITDDGSGVDFDSVEVTINGQTYIADVDRDGLYRVGVVSGARTNQPLPDGRARIIVTATDWMKNATAATFVLTVDNLLPPLGSPPPKDTGTGTTGGTRGGGGGRGGGL